MTAEEKLLTARISDLFDLCDKYSAARFSSFLDGGELAVIEDNVEFPYGFNTMLWGGYENAEHKIIGVFPEWSEPAAEAFPISLLYIKNNGRKELSHRDYLGALMSLGIERSKMGDIVISGASDAYVFAAEDITAYICDNLTKVGSCGVSITRLNELPEEAAPKMQDFDAVCASMRADAVVGAVCNISRQESSKLINGGAVKINHRLFENGAKTLEEGCLISVRGYGRFIVKNIGNATRKGRLHITISKYI